MDRTFKIGCRVIFFDSHRVAHEALVTNWFHSGPDGQTVADYEQAYRDKGITSPVWMPCCNVVWVSSDTDKKDHYGRQTERQSSCTYGRQQGFLGNCWCWPDELEEAKQLAAKAYAEAVAR